MEEMSVLELQEKMTSGELTALGLVENYLERIDQLDRHGPAINAVIELNPDAPAIAAALDQERQAGRMRGPLHGIPILIKDNIDTHDRMQTTAGSLALEGSLAPRDAFIVKRLRAAGAVILGKTNLSEWANFRGKHSVSGWSSRGGLTRNPYALDRSACGSSSGSGAAVAANLCALAVGTETDGSIICPSQTNGIVGIKPTLGLVSRSGIIPIAHSQDTAGPMARSVADAAILLGVLTGVDGRDPATRSSRSHALKDYRPFLDKNGLKGARIGVARKMAGTEPRTLKVFEACLDMMKQLGAVLIDPVDVPNFNKFAKTEMEVLHYEFKADLNSYLAGRGPDMHVRSLADVIRFNEEHAQRVMPYFGQDLMLESEAKGPLTSPAYLRALGEEPSLGAPARSPHGAGKTSPGCNLRSHRRAGLVDRSGQWRCHQLGHGKHLHAAVAGYPHITVPAGYIFGLPVGLSFIAKAWQEPLLIKLAYAFEQATRVRKPPQFRASADLSG